MKKQTHHEVANIVDQAGDILINAGYGREQILETQTAFLALLMAESRVIREYRRVTIAKVMEIFNEYGKKMIAEGLKVAKVNQLTDEQIIEVAKEFDTHSNFFGNADMDKVLTSLLTFGAIAIKENKSEMEIKNLLEKEVL